MTKENSIRLFEQKQIRTHWEEEEKWYFSIVDVISVLTEQPTHQGAMNYWKVLRNRKEIGARTGKKIVTPLNAKTGLQGRKGQEQVEEGTEE